MSTNWLQVGHQLLAAVVALLVAPLLMGWVNQCRAWLQNRSGPGVIQPARVIRKLLAKETVLASRASPLFQATPYIVFGCMVLAVSIVPMLATGLPVAPAADVIALVGLLALARVFMALAAMERVLPTPTSSARSRRALP